MIALLSRAVSALDAFLPMISGEHKAPTTSEALKSPVATTTRIYTISFTRAAGVATEEDDIVDWHTEIIEGDDGRVQCITTPVYASARDAETIETTQLLDMTELLARENVCAVTCEEITRTTVTVRNAQGNTTPYSDGEDVKRGGRPDAQGSDAHVELFETHQSLFGVAQAVSSYLLDA